MRTKSFSDSRKPFNRWSVSLQFGRRSKCSAVKLEEVDWEEDYLQQTAESPSTNGPQVSDLMEDVQNDVVVKLEEVTDWK